MKEMCLDHVEEHIKAAMDVLSLTPETLPLLTLFPVLYVAWADHQIDPSELQTILDMAQESELSEGPTGELLAKWVSKEPEPAFWSNGLYLVRVLLGPENAADQETMIEFAERVGHATEGLFGIPYTIGADTEGALKEITNALGVLGPEAKQHLKDKEKTALRSKELSWQQPVQWPWVQMASTIIVLLLGGVIYLQQSVGSAVLVPTALGKSSSLNALFQGNHFWIFVLLPLIPFVLGGAMLGWKSEGEIYTEAIFAALIPMVMYWVIWLAMGAHIKQGAWDWQRMILLFTLTLLAGAVSAAGAFFGDRLNSNR